MWKKYGKLDRAIKKRWQKSTKDWDKKWKKVPWKLVAIDNRSLQINCLSFLCTNFHVAAGRFYCILLIWSHRNNTSPWQPLFFFKCAPMKSIFFSLFICSYCQLSCECHFFVSSCINPVHNFSAEISMQNKRKKDNLSLNLLWLEIENQTWQLNENACNHCSMQSTHTQKKQINFVVPSAVLFKSNLHAIRAIPSFCIRFFQAHTICWFFFFFNKVVEKNVCRSQGFNSILDTNGKKKLCKWQLWNE